MADIAVQRGAHTCTTLPNAQFVIDADGLIGFRGDFAHGPTLYRALERLLQKGGRGEIPYADDSVPTCWPQWRTAGMVPSAAGMMSPRTTFGPALRPWPRTSGSATR